MRYGAETADDIEFKPAFLLSIFHARYRNAAEVVHVDEGASLIFAAGESNFELPAEALRIGMSQHEFRGSSRVGRHIKDFITANTGKRARSHIADGVTASFAGCYSNCREAPHQCGCIVDVNVMELKILTRCNVEDAVGVLFGKIGENVELVGG